jgi:hypothetical protein
MENALLYTFSTIAQALGGAFALLAAFVLYRFQSLSNTMPNDAAQVRGGLTRSGRNFTLYDTLRVEGKYPELIVEIDTIMEHDPGLSADEKALIGRMKRSVQLQTALEKSFRRGAFATAAVMAFSVAAIPIAPFVYCMPCFSALLLIVGVSGFLACLYLYWKVIKTAIYR